MSEVRDKIKKFSDDFLLDQYYNRHNDYTPDTVTFMKDEIISRKLDKTNDGEPYEHKGKIPNTYVSKFPDEEFVPFDHGFYKTDLLIAVELLDEEKIPFYVDSSMSSNTIPLENKANEYLFIHIPKSQLEKAVELIDRHFEKSDGLFSVRHAGIKERLKSLCFYEINLTDKELSEEAEVIFDEKERSAIIKYIDKLSKEADSIEKKTGKVLFYFDNLKECSEHIGREKHNRLSCQDLLTIMEVLQVYCDNDNFPDFLTKTAESLLDFFKR